MIFKNTISSISIIIFFGDVENVFLNFDSVNDLLDYIMFGIPENPYLHINFKHKKTKSKKSKSKNKSKKSKSNRKSRLT
jgi:hypothetical protein